MFKKSTKSIAGKLNFRIFAVENNGQTQQNTNNMNTFNFSLRGCNQFELTPCTSQKSFYGKAKVYTLSNGWKVLQSYWTFVAGIDPQGNVHRFWGGWSATTGKHIKSFCGLNKKDFTDLSLDDLCLSVL